MSALRVAAKSAFPDVAEDAQRALLGANNVPILAIGPSRARLDGETIALTHGGPPWRMLAHLCQLPQRSIVSLDELFDAGWPGERASEDSAKRRVHTAVWTLRRAGLRTALRSVGRGRYRLDARVISESSSPTPHL